MAKILSIIAVFIVVSIVACMHTNAAEMSEEEYVRLKNRLTSEFMQKLKDEIKNELVAELKSEYTIEPKQKQEDKQKSQNVASRPAIETQPSDYRETHEATDKSKAESTEEDELKLDAARYKLGEGLTFGEQMLKIKGFGNVDASYSDNHIGKSANQEGNAFFSMGEFDLFITSQLSNRISILGETVFEFESTGEVTPDLERVLIHYDVNSLLKIDVGKFHTPIGYWNRLYHHGEWLQTTVERPEILKFEDHGGPLPAHNAGIQLSGSAMLEGFDLNYFFTVSNGRGIDTTNQQNMGDLNDKKAFSFQLEAVPHSIVEGLRFGPTVYYDSIPEDETNPNRANEIRELIYGGHVVYSLKNVEFLMETFEINHDEFSGGVFNTFGGYAQGSYSIGKFKPYYRYDYINYDSKDPFYSESEFDFLDTNMHTVGLRYELSQFNALKCEVSHGVFDDEDANIIRLQTAFSF
ncbi:MAG TPA: hypothetical protein ACFYEK_16035 [Candidatus Wunengus sp. YC60]|uniref:hypothetical protein n=1 Tax=Candidatus Wunengus sp. YC60 TaxID=3367697 RepID=UPI004025A06C